MDEYNRALNRALRYLNMRSRTKLELKNYLLKKKFDEKVIQQVIEKLTETKFLNDSEYAKSFFRTRQVYKGKSKYFIKYELKQKGIADNILEEISSESQEDLKTAKDFIEKKRRIYSKLNEHEFREKMMRLLQSRGFSFDIIKQALKEFE